MNSKDGFASAGRGRARLVDVAQRSGVTKSVVSRVMNGDVTLRARPETRERVLAAALELGYQPHLGARALSVSRTGAIALLIPDLTNTVYASITRGAYRRASELGHVLLIAEDIDGPTGETEDYTELVSRGRVDGLLVASARPGNVLMQQLVAAPESIPHVFVNREVLGSDRNVGVDMRGASALAVDYLVARGHRDIGLTAGPPGLIPFQARVQGFQSRMEELGLDGSRVESGAFSEYGGYQAARLLLENHPEITALCASTFGQAVGALKAARDLGLQVPEDLSVVGYDDLSVADYLDPPLTTVAMPMDALGVAAVDALVQQLETGEPSGRRVEGGYEVIERESVASPRP